MDDTEKRILSYGIAGNIGALMGIIGILTGLGIITPLASTIIEMIMAPNLGMLIAYIRYKYKIKVSLPGVPEIPIEEPEPTPIDPII